MKFIKDQTGRRIKDIAGERFGRLVALEPTGQVENGWAVWKCVCDCGNTIEATGTSLGRDRSSCGCLVAENHKKLGLLGIKSRKRPFEYLYNRFLYDARHAGRECSLSYEDFLAYTLISTCFYCSSPILWLGPYRPKQCDSRFNLDRKDNTLGYSTDNCVVCCWTCNNSKSNRYTFEEWIVMTRALREYRVKKVLGATA